MIKDNKRLESPVGWQHTAPNEMASDVQTKGENISTEADASSCSEGLLSLPLSEGKGTRDVRETKFTTTMSPC